MATQANWYLRRLAAMSAPEIAFRLVDAARRFRDGGRTWHFTAPPASEGPRFPGLAEGVARLGLIEAWRTAYEDAREGRLAWFGVAWPRTELPDWHLDPVSGRRWPEAMFGPSIPYRHESNYGDVKYVWELNRLQYLQPIAALAHVTGEAGPADLVRRHVADWISNNPPFQGINWASGIELGLRIVSLAAAATLVDLGAGLRVLLVESLMAHGRWLARYPSRYSSANNHAVAEALGLFILGKTLAGLPEAAAWATQGRKVLERESLRQIYPDGVGCEQALGYQCFALEMLALAARFGARTDARFAAAGEFLRAVTDSKGNAPGFGDDDECRVLWSPAGPERYALAMQEAVGAAPVSPVAPQLRHAVLDHGKPPDPMADGLIHFPQGGYTVVRDGQMHLLFDHGPLGYLSIAAHGHADALSIWLTVDGEPILIDAGTYGYHGAGARRDALRGTAAHNTLTVAGADQSEIAGPFNWSRKANTRVTALTNSPWSVEAEHDGYSRRFSCIHRRRIESRGYGRFAVLDRVVGPGGPWPVRAGFLIAPGLEVRYAAGVWLLGERVRLHYQGPLTAEAQPAEYSPRMGYLEKTTRLVFEGLQENSASSRFDFSLID